MLTAEQREQFLSEGFILIRGAFPREDAIAWVRDECLRLGFDLDKPETWTKEYVRIPTQRSEPLPTYAPQAWVAACDLLGGEERIGNIERAAINLFAVNFRQGADRPYVPPAESKTGWHKDGWMFKHFLDSPDQGLLGIPLMTDVLPEGGGTFIAADSVGPMARYLAAHPEGIMPDEFDTKAILAECRDFREVTGEAGDFFLLHPFMLHAVSQNRLQRPRAICNNLYALKEPMNFHRPDGKYSPVEAAVLRGLGVAHYDFEPAAPRLRSPDGGPLNPAYR
jgi:hypothetical protein